MKVLAINGSPKGKKSCTDKILQPLLEGMRESGAIIETIYLANKKIQSCIGCFSCWFKTPGKCVFNDDMEEFLKKLIDPDLIIYGTPLYYFTMSGLVKNFLDRSLPLVSPFMKKTQAGVITHPHRFSEKVQKFFLVSSCGFPELSHFDALIATFKQFSKAGEHEYLGEIMRPSAGMMEIPEFQEKKKQYFCLLKQAGKELIEKNGIEPDTYEKLHLAWITPDDFMIKTNEYFKSVIP
jgi:multimeric flavodoxin WrbA